MPNTEMVEFNQQSDLLAVECRCPQCGDKYLHGVPYVLVPCNKCGITYRTDFKQDIYTKKARQILSKISFKDELKIRATDEYEASLINIRQHFIEQHCWDVSEISRTVEEYRRCLKCGVCFECYTCRDCGKPFKRDKNKRKQICPNCKTNNFVKSYFQKVFMSDKNKDIKLCPFCKSARIRMSRTRNKTKCHICGSRNLTEKKNVTLFEFIIKRKRAYRRDNVPSG